MASSKAQIDATARYKAKTYSRIPLDVKKEYHEYLKGIAQEHGMSLNGFIKEAIDEKCNHVKDEIPQNVITNLMEWLKNNGHSDSEIVDCIEHLNK